MVSAYVPDDYWMLMWNVFGPATETWIDLTDASLISSVLARKLPFLEGLIITKWTAADEFSLRAYFLDQTDDWLIANTWWLTVKFEVGPVWLAWAWTVYEASINPWDYYYEYNDISISWEYWVVVHVVKDWNTWAFLNSLVFDPESWVFTPIVTFSSWSIPTNAGDYNTLYWSKYIEQYWACSTDLPEIDITNTWTNPSFAWNEITFDNIEAEVSWGSLSWAYIVYEKEDWSYSGKVTLSFSQSWTTWSISWSDTLSLSWGELHYYTIYVDDTWMRADQTWPFEFYTPSLVPIVKIASVWTNTTDEPSSSVSFEWIKVNMLGWAVYSWAYIRYWLDDMTSSGTYNLTWSITDIAWHYIWFTLSWTIAWIITNEVYNYELVVESGDPLVYDSQTWYFITWEWIKITETWSLSMWFDNLTLSWVEVKTFWWAVYQEVYISYTSLDWLNSWQQTLSYSESIWDTVSIYTLSWELTWLDEWIIYNLQITASEYWWDQDIVYIWQFRTDSSLPIFEIISTGSQVDITHTWITIAWIEISAIWTTVLSWATLNYWLDTNYWSWSFDISSAEKQVLWNDGYTVSWKTVNALSWWLVYYYEFIAEERDYSLSDSFTWSFILPDTRLEITNSWSATNITTNSADIDWIVVEEYEWAVFSWAVIEYRCVDWAWNITGSWELSI